MHVLRFVTGPREGERVPVADGQSVIAGRSTENGLVIPDDTVSRKHARFFHARGRLWLNDLGSRNGTLVNGSTVRHHCLREGDRVALGANLMRVEIVAASELSRPAPKAEDSAGRSMSGTLQDIPLVDVLQWLATSRKTGSLIVKGERQGSLYLREGRVYYAKIEGSPKLKPEKALLRMLGWTDGTFGLDSSHAEDVEDEIQTSLEHALMEAARVQDEIAHLAERHPLPTGDVTLVLPSPKPWRELEAEYLDLIQAFVEGQSWQEMLDTSDRDDLSMYRLIIKMKRGGLVEFGA